jgi:hypothetical protein
MRVQNLRPDKHYVEVLLKAPMEMEPKLLEQIQQYNEWVELQEKMQGTMLLKPEWLN